nr:hypothetical protein [Tanacetum cinerariifolium]
RGPLPPVVFRKPDQGKYKPLPEVEGKWKEKVGEEEDQAGSDPGKQAEGQARPNPGVIPES